MKNLSIEQNLEIIDSMLSLSKKRFIKHSFFFLLWGWLLLLGGIVEFFLKEILNYEYHFIGWIIVSIIGVTISGWKGARMEQKTSATGIFDKVFSLLWIGFQVTLLVLIIGVVSSDGEPGSFIILLVGFPTFVSGGILKFQPLIIGGIIFWVLALLSFYIPSGYISLIFSASVIPGFIFPGYKLRALENEI